LSRGLVDVLDDLGEEFCPVVLAVVAGVVGLAGEDGQELGAGAEVGAGSQADSIRQSSSAGRVHRPLPSMRACASPRSLAMPVVS
jgi:hypothetical protein